MNSSENYNDILIDIKQVVFICGAGIVDLLFQISHLLALINYYCPNCEEIFLAIDNDYKHWRRWVNHNYLENLNLFKIDNRIQCIDSVFGEIKPIHFPIYDEMFILENLFSEDEEFIFYENSKELKWLGGGKFNSVYIDKINRVLYLTSRFTNSRQKKIELLNWNSDLDNNLIKGLKDCIDSQITNELQDFIDDKNIKDCIGLHLRLDNFWPNMLHRILNMSPNLMYKDNKYIRSLEGNVISCTEIINSHLRNYERFIYEKEREGVRIFLGSDCPLAANYFCQKYSNVIQYEKYHISNFYKRRFIDVLDPYSRKNEVITNLERDLTECRYVNDNKWIRCMYDYICLFKCNTVFHGPGGLKHAAEVLDTNRFDLGIEDEIIENYKNIGI